MRLVSYQETFQKAFVTGQCQQQYFLRQLFQSYGISSGHTAQLTS